MSTLTMQENPVKILVVDDEPLMKSLIMQSFSEKVDENEIFFLFARNGKEALKIIEENPDLGVILTDINMPEMDGLTLLGNLLKHNRPYRTVVISAYADMSNIRIAMNKGASDFITKPINLLDLEKTIFKTIEEFREIKQGITARQQMVEMNKELKIAHDIQQTFIPTEFSPFPNNNSIELIGEMLPAKEIGGDFFDFIALDDHRLGFFIADVAGKGIPAALFMSMSRTLIRGVALSSNTVEECMCTVNEILSDKNDACMFVTTFYGTLDIKTGEFNYCNAGHNPPYFYPAKEGSFTELGKNEGIPLGTHSFGAHHFKGKKFQLQKNDLLILYTDGVTEASPLNSEDFYGEDRLKSIIEKNQDKPLPELLSAIKNDILIFTNYAAQADDIAIFLIRYKGS